MAARSITADTGRRIFSARRAAMAPATIGWPRSVLQAACAAASIIKGRSAAVGSRIPNIAAKARPWSVIV
jgi:hypothetical protein